MLTTLPSSLIGFPHPFCVAFDVETGRPRLGFVANGMEIHDVSLSDCGRFDASPSMYDLTQAHFDNFQALSARLDQLADVRKGCDKTALLELVDIAGITTQTFSELMMLDEIRIQVFVTECAIAALTSTAGRPTQV